MQFSIEWTMDVGGMWRFGPLLSGSSTQRFDISVIDRGARPPDYLIRYRSEPSILQPTMGGLAVKKGETSDMDVAWTPLNVIVPLSPPLSRQLHREWWDSNQKRKYLDASHQNVLGGHEG